MQCEIILCVVLLPLCRLYSSYIKRTTYHLFSKCTNNITTYTSYKRGANNWWINLAYVHPKAIRFVSPFLWISVILLFVHDLGELNHTWQFVCSVLPNSGEQQATSSILHNLCHLGLEMTYYYILHTNSTYMSKCRKYNWNRYIKGFCLWNVSFEINRLFPIITYLIVMSWPLREIYCYLLHYWWFSV